MIRFLFWNLRGISNSSTLKSLKKLIRIRKVQMVIVIEPMVDESQS